jgi:hypothetical protein
MLRLRFSMIKKLVFSNNEIHTSFLIKAEKIVAGIAVINPGTYLALKLYLSNHLAMITPPCIG